MIRDVAVQGGVNPPSVIRGESSSPAECAIPRPDSCGEVSIDTLSFTIPVSAFCSFSGLTLEEWQTSTKYLRRSEPATARLWWAFQSLLCELFPDSGFTVSPDWGRGGRNYFHHSITLDDSAGFIAFGGNNKAIADDGSTFEVEERIQFYLSGQGCHRVSNWPYVAAVLERYLCARLTRVDIAYDDHAGAASVDTAMGFHYAGCYVSRGRPPKVRLIDDLGTGEGRTFYVGNRANGKMLRVYEKGRQLGDASSPWVRWELELTAKDRVVPFDCLTRPRDYIAGSYPALSFMSKVSEVIQTVKKKTQIGLSVLKRHARQSYGRLVSVLMQVPVVELDEFGRVGQRPPTAEEVLRQLALDGVPSRLKGFVNVPGGIPCSALAA